MNSYRICNSSAFRLALCGSVALLTQSMFSQTWQTVDDFQYVAGHGAWNFGLTVAPSGTLFAAGSANSPAGLHGVVMSSADSGAIWFGPLDDILCPGCGDGKDNAGLGCDASGTLYVAGADDDALHHWLVRQGTNGGTNWATVDDFAGPASEANEAHGLTVDAAGDVYVVGRVIYTNSVTSWTTWTVRKGVGGTSFTTVDSFYAGGYGIAQAVFVHPTAGVFVVGRTNHVVTAKNGSTTTYSIWTVRRSQDGGARWATVDSAIYGEPRGIGADASGNLYVVGGSVPPNNGGNQNPAADLAPGGSHWIVRKSSDGGNSWATVDDFLPCVTVTSTSPPYKSQTECAVGAAANAFVADAHGNLFVVGCLQPYGASGAQDQWLVRENLAGTGTWTTVDTFQYAPNQESTPAAVAADALGSVFVAGFGVDSAGTVHWLVRKD